MQAGRVGLQSAVHGLQGGRIERPPRWRVCTAYALSHVLPMDFPMCSLAVLAILTALTTEERVTWVAPQLSSATCTAQGTQGGSLGAQGCSLGA